MAKRRKKLVKEENYGITDFTGGISRRPYQVTPARGVNLDYHGQDQAAFEARQEEELSHGGTLSPMIGNLDATEQDIINVFKQVSELQAAVKKTFDYMAISPEQEEAAERILKKLDMVNTILTNDVLKNLDKLGTVDQKKLSDF